MPKTSFADIIEPSVFAEYVQNYTAEKSRLFQSGMIGTDDELNALVAGGGRKVNMPYWNDLSGDSEELSDSSSLTPAKITAAEDEAQKHYRGKAWSVNDMAGIIAGDDPMLAIADKVAAYWMREMQKNILVKSLTGVFSTALASTHVHNIALEDGDAATAANLISENAFIDGMGKLGDSWDNIVGLAMHSVPFRRLQKLNLIETEHLTDQNVTINRFLGREVLVDDGCATTAGGSSGTKYDTYLFGAGAFGFGEATHPKGAVETDRDRLAGDDILVSRRMFIMHPRGVAFTGTPAALTPTPAELATGSNWTKKYEDKQIRLVKLTTNG